MPRSKTEYLLSAAVLMVAVGLCAASFWPGRMNADTIAQIGAIETGSFSNKYAPLLQAVWYPFYHVGVGPGWVLAGTLVVCAAGMFVVLRSVVRPVLAAFGSAMVMLSPQAFGLLGLVGRDSWFLAAILMMFAALALLERGDGRYRWALLVLAIAGGFLAIAARQNAAPVVIVGYTCVAWSFLRQYEAPGTWLRRLSVSAAIALVAVLGVWMSQVGLRAALGVSDDHTLATIQLYDLGALSIQDDADYFPRFGGRKSDSAEFVRAWDPDDVMSVFAGPDPKFSGPMTSRRAEAIDNAWRDRIQADPLGYLEVRAALFLRVISVTRGPRYVYHAAIDANGNGYSTEFVQANEQANSYMRRFTDASAESGIVFRAWIYLLICAVLLVVAIVRRGPQSLLICALAGSALSYQAGLFLGSPGVAYRLEFPVIVISELLILIALAVGFDSVRRRRETAEQ